MESRLCLDGSVNSPKLRADCIKWPFLRVGSMVLSTSSHSTSGYLGREWDGSWVDKWMRGGRESFHCVSFHKLKFFLDPWKWYLFRVGEEI